MKQKIPFDGAKKAFKRLERELLREETKAERVARKQRESIPMETKEASKLGLRHHKVIRAGAEGFFQSLPPPPGQAVRRVGVGMMTIDPP
jgi:hypothetical protein